MRRVIRNSLRGGRGWALAAWLTLVASVSLLVFRSATTLAADIPNALACRGLLTGPDGEAARDGTYAVRLSYHDHPQAGTELCHWTQTTVPVRTGRFRIEVGGTDGTGSCSDVQALLRGTSELWVEMAVQDTDGSFLALRPRLPIDTTFRALHAEYAEAATGTLAEAITFPGMVAMFRPSCPAGWDPIPEMEGEIPRGAPAAGGTGGSSTTGSAGDHSHSLGGAGGHAHGTSADGAHGHGLVGCESSGWGGGLNCNGWRSATISGCERASSVPGVGGHGHGIGAVGDHGHTVQPGGTHTHAAAPPGIGVVFCRRR